MRKIILSRSLKFIHRSFVITFLKVISLIVHEITIAHDKPLVLIRESKTSISVYYQNLSFHPGALTPMNVFRKEFDHNSLDLSQAQKLQTLLKQNHPNWIEYVHSLKPSQELFSILNDHRVSRSELRNPKHDPKKAWDCVELENQIRKLRKEKGGEDLAIWINGKEWSCQELNFQDPIYVFMISSAWLPIRFIGIAGEFTNFLNHLGSPKGWIETKGLEYKWNELGPLSAYRRSIVMNTGKVEADNWFHPSQLVLNQKNIWSDSRQSALFWGAVIVGSLVLYHHLKGKTLIIEF